jgi:hypothetical protein
LSEMAGQRFAASHAMSLKLLLFIILMIFQSCGKTSNPYEESLILEHRQEKEGFYRGKLKALNPRFTGRISGEGAFFLQDIQFYAKVTIKTKWRRVTHLQFIHESKSCPALKDDLNKDGYLDFHEVVTASGKILIPLDDDLKSQASSFFWYPTSNDKGKYYYSRAVSAPAMMSDLRKKDELLGDALGKLNHNEELNISERVLIIYGVPYYYKLPDSVQGFGGFPPHMGMPIACANIIETVEEFP